MSDAPQAIAEPIVLFPRAAHFALTQRLMPLVSKWAEAPVVDDPAPGAREPDACFVTPRRAVAEFDRILVDLAMAKLLPAYEPGWVRPRPGRRRPARSRTRTVVGRAPGTGAG